MNDNSRKKTKGRGQRNRNAFSWAEVTKSGTADDCAEDGSSALKRVENGSRKFEEACEQIRKTSEQFMAAEVDYESSDEEENENQPEIMNQILASYTVGKGYEDGLGRTEQFILDSFKTGASVCLVCIATVKKNEAIWNCEFCYAMFHIPCIQKWAKESIFCQEQAMQEEPVVAKNITWFCPKCRYEYKQSQKPTKYYCFCGKEVNPKVDLWLVPHSCGNHCGKALKPECGHFCLLLCHPGPCPSCPKIVKVSCFCGRQAPRAKRCSAREWSCGKTCEKVLSCGQHKCKQPCHTGDCAPCLQTSIQVCMCKKEKRERPCADASWQCDKKCGKALKCGHHTCEKICHAGNCGPCPRTGDRTCPCGKTSLQLPCTEDVSSCGDTCDKLLDCGLHTCSKRCHFGECGLCLEMSTKRCVCGHREKFLPCHKEFRCDTKCKQIRDCGRHPCNRKCCDGNCPSCEQPCKRMLTCRNHKCCSQCHQGPCYPCPLTVTIKCNCMSTSITVPCGRERVTKPPKCSELCKNLPDCHHPKRTKHSCHFGSCPPCNQTCSKKLPYCNHSCPVRCHAAVVVKVVNEKKREGPWEPTPQPKIQIVNQACPPCKVPVPVTCFGCHETSKFPCSEAKPYSCLKECGRLLKCKNHNCSLSCHDVTDAEDEKEAGSNCEECERQCSKPRPEGCTHECMKPCHPQPCNACKLMIKLRCHCQLNILYVECNRWTAAEKESRDVMMSCNNQCPKNISCGHRCSKICHTGACSSSDECKKKVSVRCPCKRIKKEVNCHQSKKKKLECDAKCIDLKQLELQAKQKEDELRKEEESKRAQEELLKYQQKMEGKKRKQRKVKVAEEEGSMFSNKIFQVSAVLGAIVVLVYGIYLLY